MVKININSIPYQNTFIEVEGIRYNFVFRYYLHKFWTMDILQEDKPLVIGVRLSLCGLILKEKNYPFDMFILDNDNIKVDPFDVKDFESRYSLYFLERDEITRIRGYEVP